MPISVTCSGCSASFNVKDEYAGKRGKCPKCKEPLTIPGGSDTVKMPPPAGKPVTAAKQQPVADDEGDRPTPKRRRESEDADEPPKAKKRTEKVDAKPKKKKSVLPLILGILGGAVLLCGGGTAAVWFLVIVPAANNATAKINAAFPTIPQNETPTTPKQTPPTGGGAQPPTGKVNLSNMANVKAGMTLAQVEAVMGGKGKKTKGMIDMSFVTPFVPASDEVRARWKGKVNSGHVVVWQTSSGAVAAAFSDDPDAGGTVVGVVGSFNDTGSEPLKLLDPAAPNPNDKPVDPKTLPGYPEATITSAELVKNHAKYKGKWVLVTGKLKKDVPPTKDGEEPDWADVELDHPGLPIRFDGASLGTAGAKAGTEIEVVGKVDGLNADESGVSLVECLCQKPAIEVEATAIMAEYLKDKAAAKKKYENQPLKVSGKVVEDFIFTLQGSKTGKAVPVNCTALNDKTLKLKSGDQVVILTNGLEFIDAFQTCELWGGRIIALKR